MSLPKVYRFFMASLSPTPISLKIADSPKLFPPQPKAAFTAGLAGRGVRSVFVDGLAQEASGRRGSQSLGARRHHKYLFKPGTCFSVL
jgi:hypothetical protein